MTTATLDNPATAQHAFLRGVSWKTYKDLARELEGARVVLTFAEGTLEIMTPSRKHESGKSVLAFLLGLYALEKDIPITRCGSMTCQREDLEKGFEPDECFHVRNGNAVQGIETLDFTIHPPPDLVIEIEISRRLSDRKSIYAALGVPEIWLFDGTSLRVQILNLSARDYTSAERSLSFPQLPIRDFERFLLMRHSRTEHDVVKAFRDWVRLLP